jgi:serine/threonine-protein kinase
MREQLPPAVTVDQTPASGPPLPVGGSVLRALGAAAIRLRDPEAAADTREFPAPESALPAAVAGAAGRYELHGEIARGGMGAVLKGRDTDLGRDVAVKVLLKTHQGRTELVQRFVEEAQVAGQLQHPGVVPVYELGTFPDQRPFFAMKLVQGRTLADLLKERTDPGADRPRFLKVFEQVCQALGYAHARGVIHRDLKPLNIMVGAFGEVQVMDWGLAKVLGEPASRGRQPPEDVGAVRTRRSAGDAALDSEPAVATQAGTILGTPAYMAPEQARGEVERLDARSDVFGLGAILCEILTGKPPHTGGELLRRAATAELGEAFARLDGCGADAELVGLCQRCLAAEPQDRLPDAAALAAELIAYRESVEARLHRAELDRAAAQAKAQEERKRRRMQLALAASLLLLVVAGGGGWLWVAQERAARDAEDSRLAQERERQARERDRKIQEELAKARLLRAHAKVAKRQQERRSLAAEALAAAQRADGLAAGEHSDPELRRRVATTVQQLQEEERDRRMVERLTTIREDQAEMGDNMFDEGPSDAAYARAFREYGIDPEALPPQETARRVRARPIARELVAALDDWAKVRRTATRPDDAASWRPLVEAARAADPEPWRDRLRGALLHPEADRELLRELSATADLRAQSPEILNHLAFELVRVDVREAVALLRKARQQYPDDFALAMSLGLWLEYFVRPAPRDEALRCWAVCVAVRPQSAGTHLNLGKTLCALGRDDEALLAFETALRLKDGYAAAHDFRGQILARQKKYNEALKAHARSYKLKERAVPLQNMAWVRNRQGKPAEAEDLVRKAIAMDPEDPMLYYNLSGYLRQQGKLQAAIDALRESLNRLDAQPRLKGIKVFGTLSFRSTRLLEALPGNAYNDLGSIRIEQGHPDEALAELEKGLILHPQNALLHLDRGVVLLGLGRTDAAIAAFLTALKHQPTYQLAHVALGDALVAKKQPGGAVAAYEKAVALRREDHATWFKLADALEKTGQFATAVVAWQQGLQALPAADPQRAERARRRKQAENWAQLERQLPRVVAGQFEPASAAELTTYAQFARATGRFLGSVRLWQRALARHPELTTDPNQKDRYDAAVAAALAGTGQGRDAELLDDEGRARCRALARTWLRQDLKELAQLVNDGTDARRALAQKALLFWQGDAALAGVRDRAALARLPAVERDAWGQLWDDVGQLLKKASDGK